MTDTTGSNRATVDILGAPGGWPDPWPNVEELAGVLPSDKWTLIGGLMAQLHTVHYGIGVVRPTNDIDIVLHIETSRGVPAATARALESVGYQLNSAVDPRDNTAHRFTRGKATVDVVTSATDPGETSGERVSRTGDHGTVDTVDVLLADHPAPAVEETMRGKTMVKVEGGCVPDRLEKPGQTSLRAGSDRPRILGIQKSLPDDHAAWLRLSADARRSGQAALRLLCQPL